MSIKSIFAFLQSPTIYKFAAIGAIGSIVALVITGILTSKLGIFYAVSALVGLESSSIIVFFLNEKWTFSYVIKKTKTIQRLIKGHLVSFMGFGINETILILLTSVLGIHYLVSECIAMIITFAFTFTASKKFTWKH